MSHLAQNDDRGHGVSLLHTRLYFESVMIEVYDAIVKTVCKRTPGGMKMFPCHICSRLTRADFYIKYFTVHVSCM